MALANPRVRTMFSVTIDDVDYITDITSFKLATKGLPADQTTFKKYTEGRPVKWELSINVIFDGGSEGSLHDYLWNNSGATADFLLKPFEDFDPDTKRFFQGTMRIPRRPDIRIKAGSTSTFAYTFEVIGQPTRSDTPGGFVTEGIFENF